MFKMFSKFKNLKYGISNVSDGNMSFKFEEKEEILKNRKNFLKNIGIPLDKCVGISLAHDSKILTVFQEDTSGCAVKTKEGDALLTNERGLFLFMMTADCLPIILFDPSKMVLALVHCGWKSTEEKIAQKTISKMMASYESKASDIVAAIGPGIHKESYKFENPAVENLPGWKPFLNKLKTGEYEIDLVGYNVSQLEKSGILPKNIEVSPVDTVKNKNYFSHYRSVRTEEPEGRFCTVIGITE
jgi:hypothetical protein